MSENMSKKERPSELELDPEFGRVSKGDLDPEAEERARRIKEELDKTKKNQKKEK